MSNIITSTRQYVISLKEKLENKILVTLKHFSDTPYSHNQLSHGWRYGANVLRPNGVGTPSQKRGQAYLKKLRLQAQVGVGKVNSTGARGIRVMQRNGVRNMLMEHQRREETGATHWNHGKAAPSRGRQTNLEAKLNSKFVKNRKNPRTDASIGKNPKKYEGARDSNKWSRTPAKLIRPTKNPVKNAKLAKNPKNRVSGERGMSNPKKNQNAKFEAAAAKISDKIIKGIKYQRGNTIIKPGIKNIFKPQPDINSGRKLSAAINALKKGRAKVASNIKKSKKEIGNSYSLMQTPSMLSIVKTLESFHSYIKNE